MDFADNPGSDDRVSAADRPTDPTRAATVASLLPTRKCGSGSMTSASCSSPEQVAALPELSDADELVFVSDLSRAMWTLTVFVNG